MSRLQWWILLAVAAFYALSEAHPYVIVGTHPVVYRLNRFTGAVAYCTPNGCKDISW
jgi:hypothetical protein